jgi:predicted Zn-dependent protease
MRKFEASRVVTAILLVALSVLSGAAWFNTYKIDDYSKTSPGEWSRYYLKGDEFGRLIIEFDWMSNIEVNKTAVSLFRDRALGCVDKPAGIETSFSTRIAKDKSVYSYNITRIEQLESRYRDCKPDAFGGRMTLYVLYLDGYYMDENNTLQRKVLGLTYRGSSVVVFRNVVWGGSEEPALKCRKEAAVLVHELGHLLGLVNIGYKSDISHEHYDTQKHEYDNHCNDTHCVMYPEIELQDGNPTGTRTYSVDFCSNCSRDLASLKMAPGSRILPRNVFLGMTAVSVCMTVIYTGLQFRKGRKEALTDARTGEEKTPGAPENFPVSSGPENPPDNQPAPPR